MVEFRAWQKRADWFFPATEILCSRIYYWWSEMVVYNVVSLQYLSDWWWPKKGPTRSPGFWKCCPCRRMQDLLHVMRTHAVLLWATCSPLHQSLWLPACRKKPITYFIFLILRKEWDVFGGVSQPFALVPLRRVVFYLKSSVMFWTTVHLIKIPKSAFSSTKASLSFCLPFKSSCWKQTPGVES